MNNFNDLISDYRWSDSTLLLYILIIVFSTFFAWLSQSIKKEIKNNKETMDYSEIVKIKINYFFLTISFIILWFFSAFRKIGADYEAYKTIFLRSNDPSYWASTTIEPGYLMLNYLVRLFTDSEILFFAIISFITIFLVYRTIIYYADKIHVGLAVFAYSSLFYLQSYNLVRIYLASAIIFFAFRYISNKQYLRYILSVLIAMSIHASAVLMFLPFAIILMFKRSKALVLLVLFLFLTTSLLFSDYLIAFNFSERYTSYLTNTRDVDFGFGQLAFHAPVIILLFFSNKFKLDRRLLHIFYIYTFSSFTMSMLGYGIPMIGRMSAYFTYPYILFLSYFLFQMKIRRKGYSYLFIRLFIITFLVWRLYMYLVEYLLLDGLMPYTNIFDWVF